LPANEVRVRARTLLTLKTSAAMAAATANVSALVLQHIAVKGRNRGRKSQPALLIGAEQGSERV
jgi:hypothetical protein